MQNLVELLQAHCKRDPEKRFIHQTGTGTRYSYQALSEHTNGCLAFLNEYGIAENDVVLFQHQNNWLIYPLLIASSLNGNKLASINASVHSRELGHIYQNARPKLIVHTGSRLSSPSAYPYASHHCIAKHVHCDDLITPSLQNRRISTRPLLMIYTSGTTGAGKGVLLSENNLLHNARTIGDFYPIDENDTFYCILPTHHMNALMITGLVPFVKNAAIILSEPFNMRNARHYFETVQKYHVTVLSLIPSIMGVLLKLFPKPMDLGSLGLKFAFCGAAPLDATLWKTFEEHFGIPVYQGYGLTETTCWATLTPTDTTLKNYDSVGIPVGCDVKISSKANQPNEILISGKNIFSGYYRLPPAVKNGWLKTGDTGYFDKNGLLYINGRIKDIIIRNGQNIYSGHVDHLLCEHDAIAEAATIGVPHELRGESIYAFCVLKNRYPDQKKITTELKRWIKENFSDYSAPDKLIFVDYLPKGETGKIRKVKLKSLFSDDLASRIISVFSWKYRRNKIFDETAILKRIRQKTANAQPLLFLKYWGAGNRDRVNQYDLDALSLLADIIAQINALYFYGAKLTLLFTDTHTKINRKDKDRVTGYFAGIKNILDTLAIDCEVIHTSTLWQNQLTMDRVKAFVRTEEFVHVWNEDENLKDLLISQAKKHAHDVDKRKIAMRYFGACLLEKKIYTDAFGDHVFLTYDHRRSDILLPDLPKIHLYSYKQKVSEKPWFTN